jgi:prevent-host-death family protein
MEEIPISKFKATCLAVLEKVRRTGQPIRVTRFGQPMADIQPPAPTAEDKIELGTLRHTLKYMGDIVSPVSDPADWEVLREKPAAGHAYLDLERDPARKTLKKGPRRGRKSTGR